MSFPARLPAKRGLSLGFGALAVSLGCSSFSAQGGTAGLGGAWQSAGGAEAGGTSAGGTSGASSGGAGAPGANQGGNGAAGKPVGSGSADAGNAGESSAGDDSGAANAAGMSSGGASGSVGAGGHGGQRACDLGECFVANRCLDQCGGKIVYVGCCECDPPSVNQNTCAGGR
jgi:hypothetical protein